MKHFAKVVVTFGFVISVLGYSAKGGAQQNIFDEFADDDNDSFVAGSSSDKVTFNGGDSITTNITDDSGIDKAIEIDVTDDSINGTELADSITLDATTTFDMDTNSADLNFDSGTLFIDNAGYVGIGTTTPTFNLEITGSVGPTTDDTYDLGSTTSRWDDVYIGAAGALCIGADSVHDAMISYSSATNNLSFACDGAFYFMSDVGIGTSPDDFKLEINGDAGPATDDTYDLGSNALRWQDLYLGPSSLHIGTTTGDEGTLSYNTTDNNLEIESPSDVLLQPSSGNVGIGTTDPSSALEVAGTIESDKVQARTGSGLALFEDGGTGIFVEDGGDVGIGTTSPTADLHINSAASSRALRLFDDGTSSWVKEVVSGQYRTILEQDTPSVAFVWGERDKADSAGSSIAEWMRIDSSGKVGIGTTSPDRTLTVDGEIQIQASGTDKWHLNTTGSGDLYFTETGVDTRIKFLSGGAVMPNSSKAQDLGSDSWPWDDVYADDYTTKCDWVDPQETDVVSAVMNIDFEMITKEDGTVIPHLDHSTMPEFTRIKEKVRHQDGTWKGAYWKDGEKVTLGSYEMDGEVFYPENDRPVNAQAVPEGAEWIGEYSDTYLDAYSINKMQVLLIETIKQQQAEIEDLKSYLGL